jgi:hypothetical protein
MRYALIPALLLISVPAFAAEVQLPPECRVLPEHKAAADVNYQPGVDVHGKAVVPADVNSNPMGMNQTIVVPLTIDLAQRLQGMNVQGLNLETTLGFLEFSPDGRVTYDGQDLTTQVHVLCSGKGVETVASPPPVTDRQTPPDVLKSAPVKEIKPAPPKPVIPPAPAQQPAPKPVEKGELLQGQDYKD